MLNPKPRLTLPPSLKNSRSFTSPSSCSVPVGCPPSTPTAAVARATSRSDCGLNGSSSACGWSGGEGAPARTGKQHADRLLYMFWFRLVLTRQADAGMTGGWGTTMLISEAVHRVCLCRGTRLRRPALAAASSPATGCCRCGGPPPPASGHCG